MERYSNDVTDRRGNAISGSQVTIKTAAGATATIYSDDGVTTATNPLTTSADGEYTFFAENGKYTITTVSEGYGTEVVDNVVLYDPTDEEMLVHEITTAAYTLSDDDIGQWLDFNTSATATVTITTATAYADGDSTIFSQKGAGQVVLEAGSGVTIRVSDAAKTRVQESVIGVTRVAADTYQVFGDLAAS